MATPTTQTHTLENGKTLAATTRFGFQGVRMVSGPRRLFGLIVGPSNIGKTHFFMSHPGAMVINLDLSSTPTAEAPKAMYWPGISEDGRPIDLNGEPIILSWHLVQRMKAVLLEAAKNNDPSRPETIVIDSLAAAISLVKDYVTALAGKTSFDELHGKSAWDDVYNEIINFANDLRNHGYGVYMICHMTEKYIPLDENKNVRVNLLTITDSFYKRLYHRFEFVGAISKETTTEMVDVSQPTPLKNPDGTPKMRVVKQPKVVTKRFLVTSAPDVEGITKVRVVLPPTIELPASSAWDTFERAYRSAMQTSNQPQN